jgi:thiamine biosynthesis lipoprotein
MPRVELATASFRSMGTDVDVLAPIPDRDASLALVHGVFAAWDHRFSRFRSDSELSRLNASAGTRFAASSLMLEVAAASLVAARVTDGLFDPTLLHRLVTLGYDDRFERLPADRSAQPIDEWQPGRWAEIEIDRAAGWIKLPAGTGMDLGGIAKGMAVDAAIAALSERRIAPAAVNAGGDLAVNGPLDGGWPIAIDDAGGRTILLQAGALATSSVLHRRWRVGNQERPHLLDPRTGMPVAGRVASASVAAPSCRAAEVAAKAALLLGPEQAAFFLAAHRLSGLLVMHDGRSWNIGNWKEVAA